MKNICLFVLVKYVFFYFRGHSLTIHIKVAVIRKIYCIFTFTNITITNKQLLRIHQFFKIS